MKAILLLCLVTAAPTDEAYAEPFSDVQIQGPFNGPLLNDPFLMETTGAKVIELTGGRRMLIGVGSTVPDSDSPGDRLRAERVCQTKALAALVAHDNPVQLIQTQQTKDCVVVVIENRHERAESTSAFVETIQTRFEGSTRCMPVVGRWMSRDRKVLYLAIGAIEDRADDPAPIAALVKRAAAKPTQRRRYASR